MVRALVDVALFNFGKSDLKLFAHTLINIACIWWTCFMHIPGITLQCALHKHEGNQTRVKIELVLFNNGRYQTILVI